MKKQPPIAPLSLSVWYDPSQTRWLWSIHKKKIVIGKGSSIHLMDATSIAAAEMVRVGSQK